jgi:hypothetical protein
VDHPGFAGTLCKMLKAAAWKKETFEVKQFKSSKFS